MESEIWKWVLDVDDEQEIEVPRGTRFLSVQNQGGKITVWGLVPVARDKVKVKFYILGTGYRSTRIDGMAFFGTVQLGHFVWHIFTQGELYQDTPPNR